MGKCISETGMGSHGDRGNQERFLYVSFPRSGVGMHSCEAGKVQGKQILSCPVISGGAKWLTGPLVQYQTNKRLPGQEQGWC